MIELYSVVIYIVIVDLNKSKVGGHIIYEHEESFWPAIIQKKLPKWPVVNNMKPVRPANPRLWMYGADKAYKQCLYNQVRHISK